MEKFRTVIIKLRNGKEKSVVIKSGKITACLCKTCCDERNITNVKVAQKEGLFYEYKDGKVICPRCGTTIDVVKTPEEIEKEREDRIKEIETKAQENLQIVEAGRDFSTGINFYALSARVDYETVWPKIKKYFSYYSKGWSDECDGDFLGYEPTGWLTTQPQKVEEILVELGLIKPENTMKARQEKAKKEAEERKKLKEEKDALKKEIDEHFELGKIDDSYFEELRKVDEERKENEKLKMEVELNFYNPSSERVEKIEEEIIEEYTNETLDTYQKYLISEKHIFLKVIEKRFNEVNVIFKADFSGELVEKIRKLQKKVKNIGEPKITKNKNVEKPVIDEYPHTIEEYGDTVVKRYENPNYPFNIYGGGQEWIICEDHIWFVRNNGSDGSDWSQNNVATGGAGAIGVRVHYSRELEKLIEKYVKISL